MNEMTNSHILVHEFDYLQPATVKSATSLLSQYGNRARVLAGGTDLIVQIKMERLAPEFLIDINAIAELDGITVREGSVHIGTRTSVRTIRNALLVQVKAVPKVPPAGVCHIAHGRDGQESANQPQYASHGPPPS